MASGPTSEYVAECLWPDVHEDDLQALDERVTAETRRFVAVGEPVSYLGSLLMREDEVVLCLFRGDEAGVRHVARAAQVPYDRILETARSPWSVKSTE